MRQKLDSSKKLVEELLQTIEPKFTEILIDFHIDQRSPHLKITNHQEQLRIFVSYHSVKRLVIQRSSRLSISLCDRSFRNISLHDFLRCKRLIKWVIDM